MNVTVPVDKNWKSVAIAVSGGADSALLAFLVCNQVPGNRPFLVHIINNIRCWKTKPWQQQDVKNVIQWLENRFPNITFKVHTNFVPPELEWGNVGRTITDEYGKLVSGDTLELRAFAEYVCFTQNVDAYFNGVTRNPKDVNFEGMPTRDIDPTDNNKHLEQMMHMGKLVCHPFRFVEKSWVMLQYKLLGIGSLFDLTRSCEGEFENLNYQNYTPGQYVPVCEKCFWCKERKWAIESTTSAK
jgi:hypothetical protein